MCVCHGGSGACPCCHSPSRQWVHLEGAALATPATNFQISALGRGLEAGWCWPHLLVVGGDESDGWWLLQGHSAWGCGWNGSLAPQKEEWPLADCQWRLQGRLRPGEVRFSCGRRGSACSALAPHLLVSFLQSSSPLSKFLSPSLGLLSRGVRFGCGGLRGREETPELLPQRNISFSCRFPFIREQEYA